ncbi:MAG: STN domain-containing protein, partial [Bacteroidales bacterium]
MKLTLLLLCSNVFLAVGNSYAQNTKFTFSGNSVRLSEVLEEIKENSEFSFFYNHELIDLTQIVSYDVEDATVFEILDKVLAKTGIKYEVIDKTIILSPVPVQVKSKVQQTQKKTVTGTVTDKDGL